MNAGRPREALQWNHKSTASRDAASFTLNSYSPASRFPETDDARNRQNDLGQILKDMGMSAADGNSKDANIVPPLDSVQLDGSDLSITRLEQSDDCIKILSIDGHLEFMNCSGLKAMEIDSPELVIGTLWWELWPVKSRQFVKQQFLKAIQGQETSFEADCPTAKGAHRRWIVNLKPRFAPNGPVVSVLSTSRNLTDM